MGPNMPIPSSSRAHRAGTVAAGDPLTVDPAKPLPPAAAEEESNLSSPEPSPQPPALVSEKGMLGCVAAMTAAISQSLLYQRIQLLGRHGDPLESNKLQLYFNGLVHEDGPQKRKVEQLENAIQMLEDDLKTKCELIKKYERLIRSWQKKMKDQLGKHITALERM